MGRAKWLGLRGIIKATATATCARRSQLSREEPWEIGNGWGGRAYKKLKCLRYIKCKEGIAGELWFCECQNAHGRATHNGTSGSEWKQRCVWATSAHYAAYEQLARRLVVLVYGTYEVMTANYTAYEQLKQFAQHTTRIANVFYLIRTILYFHNISITNGARLSAILTRIDNWNRPGGWMLGIIDTVPSFFR